MSADRLYLVFSFSHHRGPVYLHRMAEISGGARGVAPTLKPVFDDDIERSQVWTNAEFAVQARDHWRGQGFSVSIFDRDGNGPLFERTGTDAPISQRPVQHEAHFVALQGEGVDRLGYLVRFSPERRQWYCRAIDIPSMSAERRDMETLWAESAEGVANKIIQVWGLSIARPFEDPEAAARAERERQQAAQQLNRTPSIRPGDRR